MRWLYVPIVAMLLSACGTASGTSSSGSPSAAGKPQVSSAAPKPASQQVHVLWGTTTGAHTFVRVADEKGFFQQNGVSADAQYAIASTAIAALVAGQAHFVVTGAVEAIQAMTSGAPLKMLAFNQVTNPYGLFAQPSIRGAQDLKGKTIAVGVKGDTSDISLRMALALLGLNADRDVNTRTVGNSPARWTALSSGQIDAAILDEDQYAAEAKKQGMQLIVSLSQKQIPYAAGGVTVNADFARANPDIASGILKGLIQGGRFMQDPNNRSEAIASMAKDLKRQPDDPLVADVYAAESRKTAMHTPYALALDTILTALRGIDSARYASLTTDQVIDGSFMAKLRADGFLTPAEGGGP